jgi:hypothetical protein
VERNPSNRSVWFGSLQDFSRIPAQDRHIWDLVLSEPLVELIGQLGLDLDADDAALGLQRSSLE